MTFPSDWYWAASDGRVFSSAHLDVVPKDDADYADFLAGGAVATTWPVDETGAQTSAALDAVLMPYGLSTSGAVRMVSVVALLDALSSTQRGAVSSDNMGRPLARGAGGSVIETNAKVVRAAKDAGIKPEAWFDLAIGVS